MTVSGLPPDKFTFVSYLPKKDVKRKSFLEDLKKGREIVKSTIIIFESPYRLIKSLEDIKQIFGDIEIVVCRELTKMHEEIKSAKVSQVIEYFLQSALKGEFIILF